jgi:hypothetical protein
MAFSFGRRPVGLDRSIKMADNLADAIQTNAAGPKSASGDSGSMTQHDLTQQIEADKYLAGKNAMAKPGRGLRFTKLSAPGAV